PPSSSAWMIYPRSTRLLWTPSSPTTSRPLRTCHLSPREVYLQLVPVTVLPLRGKGFKVKTAGEEKVGGKAAVVLEVTGPDSKDFKLSFDKESGLPVKMVAKV